MQSDPTFYLEVLLESLTLLILVSGWVGLLIPIFPGLTVMWLGTLIYAVVQTAAQRMTWVGWTLFALITLLMLGGNVVDNILIAKHVRDKNVPWLSIAFAFVAGVVVSLTLTPLAGMIASPAALFLAEWRRLRDRRPAFINTKAWMVGWGWSVVARLGIGLLMIVLWGFWAWL